jgi:hypothetical protein
MPDATPARLQRGQRDRRPWPADQFAGALADTSRPIATRQTYRRMSIETPATGNALLIQGPFP